MTPDEITALRAKHDPVKRPDVHRLLDEVERLQRMVGRAHVPDEDGVCEVCGQQRTGGGCVGVENAEEKDRAEKAEADRDRAFAACAAMRSALAAVCAPSHEVPLGAIIIGRKLLDASDAGRDFVHSNVARAMAEALRNKAHNPVGGCNCHVCVTNADALAAYDRAVKQ